MRSFISVGLILVCFSALFLLCYAPALFFDRQFGYRDAVQFYYPLYERVQQEWNEGRWPLWEREENSGFPLLGNPTAAVLYPGKLIYAAMPYPWAARIYIVVHSALAFVAMLVLMRSWGTSWIGSGLSALGYAYGAPILFQYCNVIYLVGAAWLPLGVHAVDRWLRLGRRWGLWELAVVLSMLVLGGDPEVAYVLGMAGCAYAVGLYLTRGRASGDDQAPPAVSRPGAGLTWWALGVLTVGLVLYCAGTIALGVWLPTLRETTYIESGRPTSPFRWMLWAPLAVTVVWGLAGLAGLFYWWRRGRRFPPGVMLSGLALAAVLAVSVTAIQLLPMLEFTQLTGRAAGGGPHEIYPFSVEPQRLIELFWPNIFGVQYLSGSYWLTVFRVPGVRPKIWVPSLYLGGLTCVLGLGSLSFRRGPAWRVWLSGIVLVSLLGSLGAYTSPIWGSRAILETTRSEAPKDLLRGLGPIDPEDTTPIRADGYLRDGDGGFYWLMSMVLPGFRQFRFPAKLFTFTSMGLAALAGAGWDRAGAGSHRRHFTLMMAIFVVSVGSLASVVALQQPIMAWFGGARIVSIFGPFEADRAYAAIVKSLGHAGLVYGFGLVLLILVRSFPRTAGVLLLILATIDLAAANTRYVLTVPQSLLESKSTVLQKIEEAERDRPAPGPFRIHRMPLWNPMGWYSTPSDERINEFVSWERDTLQPKSGITLGVEYTHTIGVAELYDYEWYFAGFYRTVFEPEIAKSLGIEVGKEVVYFPRRAFDMWNTRYFIVPSFPNGWRDELRGSASFMFGTEPVYPKPDKFAGPNGAQAFKDWVETRDFKVYRNLQELPRSWVVHQVRRVKPVRGLSRDTRDSAMQEILFADDPIWRDSTQRAYDPLRIAWVGSDDFDAISPSLSERSPSATEAVKVTYVSPQQVVLEATLDSPGLIVLADVYYPGWELLIDEKPAPIYRVNGAMRGAALSKGPHTLVYTYAPNSFYRGAIVTVGGLFALVLLGAWCVARPVEKVLGSPAP
jgi:hypothetical protein